MDATANGHTEIVKLLLSAPHPVRADAMNSRALCVAVEAKHTEIVKLLLWAPEHPAKTEAVNTELRMHCGYTINRLLKHPNRRRSPRFIHGTKLGSK